MAQQHRPTALVLTRQNLPTLDRTKLGSADGVSRGGYVAADAPGGKPRALLMASGSELSLAIEAQENSRPPVCRPAWSVWLRLNYLKTSLTTTDAACSPLR